MKTVEAILKEASFTVSERCISRPSCFDFVARKEKRVLLIKVQPVIRNVTTKDSQELRDIAEHFSGSPLIVGEDARERPLEDDTVYSRYGISAINAKTFENVIIKGISPLIQASPGGYHVEISRGALSRRRQELGVSIGEVAELVGVSRRTVYGYERGLTKASVVAAYNLARVLGIPVGRSVDIFQHPRVRRKNCLLLNTARRVFARNKFLSTVFRKLAPLNITTVRKAPFDFLLDLTQEKPAVIGGIANEEQPILDRRIDEILSVSRIVKARPVLITEGQKLTEKEIPCISSEEFSAIKHPEDFLAEIR